MPVLNLGEVKNQGFDIVAGWNGEINDFHYSLDGNFTYSKQNSFMDEIPPVEAYQTTTGHPHAYYGYIWEGFIQKKRLKQSILKENQISI